MVWTLIGKVGPYDTKAETDAKILVETNRAKAAEMVLQQGIDDNAGKTAELDADLKTGLGSKVDKSQGTENAGKFLKVGEDGTIVLGEGGDSGSGLPDQTGHTGFLQTDGTTATWSDKEAITNNATGFASIAIGANSSVVGGASNRIAIGNNASITEAFGLAIGNRATVTAEGAIQISQGSNSFADASTNNEPYTFKVALGNKRDGSNNYKLLNSDGTIPTERLADGGTTGQVISKTDTGMQWVDMGGACDYLIAKATSLNRPVHLFDYPIDYTGAVILWANMYSESASKGGVVLIKVLIENGKILSISAMHSGKSIECDFRYAVGTENNQLWLSSFQVENVASMIDVTLFYKDPITPVLEKGDSAPSNTLDVETILLANNKTKNLPYVTINPSEQYFRGITSTDVQYNNMKYYIYSDSSSWNLPEKKNFCVWCIYPTNKNTSTDAGGLFLAIPAYKSNKLYTYYGKVQDLTAESWEEIGGGDASASSITKGDYCTTYGIVKMPEDIITSGLISSDDITMTIPAGLTVKTPAGRATNASAAGHIVTSTTDFTLFYASGNWLECGKVDYSAAEPSDNGVDNYQAWWNGTVWKFKSNDTGNVWREIASATPICDCFFTGSNLTRIETVGYNWTGQTVENRLVAKQDPTEENGYTWYRKYAGGWVEQGGIISTPYIIDYPSKQYKGVFPIPLATLCSRTAVQHWKSGGITIISSANADGNNMYVTLRNIDSSSDFSYEVIWSICGYAA